MTIKNHNGLDRVQTILNQADVELKSIEVIKDIPLQFDPGNLVVTDNNDIDKEQFGSEEFQSSYLKELSRECAQGLLNSIWDLPTETIENMLYVSLPKPSIRLPREKKVPKAKQRTKWEQYALDKGISKKKKGGKVWDEILKKWIPLYGLKKVQAVKEKNWVMEVPDNADPFEDQFAKAADTKKENIAKNEYKRLRNLAKQKNITVPKVGLLSANEANKSEVGEAISQARVSTASLGRFQPLLKEEKPLPEKRGKKRKMVCQKPPDDTPKNFDTEKQRGLEILNKIHKPDLDMEMAVGKQIRQENVELSHQGKKKSVRRSKMGKKSQGKSAHKALAKGAGFGRNRKKGSLFAKAVAKGGESSAGGKGKRSAKPKGGESKKGGHQKSKMDRGRKRR